MRVRRHRLNLLLLLLLIPTLCSADINKDLKKCRQTQDGPSRAACFNKLIPRIDELSKSTPADTPWAEALKEAYGATGQFDKIAEADRRIQIGAGASKLLSSVISETNSKPQGYTAVAQYYEALGPEWTEAAKHASSLGKSNRNGIGDLPESIRTQVADAVKIAQQRDLHSSTPAASPPVTLTPGIGLQNKCIKSTTVSDDSDFSGRHLASVTVRNTCSEALTVYLCVKSDRAQCWTCKRVGMNPGQEAKGPTSIGFGDCTNSSCNGVSVIYNASAQGNPPKPNVDDSCQPTTR
jgi:hypothetical protein